MPKSFIENMKNSENFAAEEFLLKARQPQREDSNDEDACKGLYVFFCFNNENFPPSWYE